MSMVLQVLKRVDAFSWACGTPISLEQLFNLMLISSSKKACPLKDAPPPGTAIYTKDGYSIHEIDGEEHKVPYPKSSTFRTQGLSSLI